MEPDMEAWRRSRWAVTSNWAPDDSRLKGPGVDKVNDPVSVLFVVRGCGDRPPPNIAARPTGAFTGSQIGVGFLALAGFGVGSDGGGGGGGADDEEGGNGELHVVVVCLVLGWWMVCAESKDYEIFGDFIHSFIRPAHEEQGETRETCLDCSG